MENKYYILTVVSHKSDLTINDINHTECRKSKNLFIFKYIINNINDLIKFTIKLKKINKVFIKRLIKIKKGSRYILYNNNTEYSSSDSDSEKLVDYTSSD